jgi:hypothetical protein
MRSILALSLLAAVAAPALAQNQPPVPTNLDEMIATALRASPEVLLAEAKLRQAQAELNQTRLKVTREVVGAFNEKKQKQSAIVTVERELQFAAKTAASGATSAAEVEKVKARLSEAELGIAQSDADLRYLLGVGSQLDPNQFRDPAGSNEKPRKTVARPDTIPESLREALAKPVSVQFNKVNFGDVLTGLSQQSGASILIDFQAGISTSDNEFTLVLGKPVPLATVLQALSDLHDFVFVFRDYGILVTSEQRAMSMRAPAIPQGLRLDPEAK